VPSSLDYGLVGYWPFNERAGNVARDWSGNGNHGTLVNSPQWVAGKFGGALSFSNNNQGTNLPPNPNFGSSSFSVSFWFKSGINTAVDAFIFGNEIGENPNYPSGTTQAFEITYDTRNMPTYGPFAIRLTRPNNADYALYTINVPYATSWTHVVVAVIITSAGAGYVNCYINGTQVQLNNNGQFSGLTSAFNNSNNFNLVSSSYSFPSPGATLDDVRIYNRALIASEIQALYYQGAF
jgi:hypothetical protein